MSFVFIASFCLQSAVRTFSTRINKDTPLPAAFLLDEPQITAEQDGVWVFGLAALALGESRSQAFRRQQMGGADGQPLAMTGTFQC